MTKSMRVFEIFLSSPGDVEQERDDAQAVINDINNDPEFRDIRLKLYRWDDEEMVLHGKLWHRSYYGHIIRDEDRLNTLRLYIALNPERWTENEAYPHNMKE